MNCIFCAIAGGKIPSHKVYEDEHTLAFLDINPISDGHTLVIPKHHHENLLEVSEDDAMSVAKTVKKVANAVKKTFNADGVNVLQANGAAAGQSVLHYHVHVVPRKENDGLKLWPPTKRLGHEGSEMAEKIKENM